MPQTIVGLYDTLIDAQRSVQDLVNNGFPRDDISIVTNDVDGNYARYLKPESTLATEGAGGGAVIGALTGLLIGMGALTLPGIGAAIIAGPLLGMIGAGIGAMTGGLLGALVSLGISEDSASYYAEGIRRGATLLIVQTADEMANRATQIVNRHGPVDVERRSALWRAGGWTSFDEKAAALTKTDLEREQKAQDRQAGAGVG